MLLVGSCPPILGIFALLKNQAKGPKGSISKLKQSSRQAHCFKKKSSKCVMSSLELLLGKSLGAMVIKSIH